MPLLIDPINECEIRDDPDWFESFRRANQCSGCGAIASALRQSGFDVPIHGRPPKGTVFWLDPVLIGAAPLDFVELLMPEFAEHMSLGHLLSRHGKPIAGFVTFLGRQPIRLRGSVDSEYKVCDTCGRGLYGAADPRYILAADLKDQPIYEDYPCGLLLMDEIKNRIDRRKLKGVWAIDIPVLDEPRDGLGELAPYW